jgi:hypothetical protein
MFNRRFAAALLLGLFAAACAPKEVPVPYAAPITVEPTSSGKY